MNKPLPPQSTLVDLFYYSVLTGFLYWRKSGSGRKTGVPAGRVSNRGYRSVRVQGVEYAAHRLIWRWVTGDDPGDLQVDHEDRQKDNNAWHNLRLVTASDNCFNRVSTDNATHCHFHSGVWVVRRYGKVYGYYKSEEDARQRVVELGWHKDT